MSTHLLGECRLASRWGCQLSPSGLSRSLVNGKQSVPRCTACWNKTVDRHDNLLACITKSCLSLPAAFSGHATQPSTSPCRCTFRRTSEDRGGPQSLRQSPPHLVHRSLGGLLLHSSTLANLTTLTVSCRNRGTSSICSAVHCCTRSRENNVTALTVSSANCGPSPVLLCDSLFALVHAGLPSPPRRSLPDLEVHRDFA